MYLIQSLIEGISLGALYALFALGIAVTFGVMRMMNFAHGELIMAGGYAFILVGNYNIWLGILAALGAAGVTSLILERVAFRPLRGREANAMLVGSFAVSYLLQSLAAVVFGANPRTASTGISALSSLQLGSLSISYLNIGILVSAFVLMVLLSVVLNHTRAGLQLRAVSEDEDMARVLGVRLNVVIPVAFVISGLLAGAAAILLTIQTGTVVPTSGLNPLVIAFIATILGGLGSFKGAVAGAMVLGVASELLAFYLPIDLRSFSSSFGYLAVLVILVALPEGIFSNRRLRTRV